MVSFRTVCFSIAIAWFAMLQAFSPLLHAHLETDNSLQPHGVHIHGFNSDMHQDQFQHVSIAHGEAHIISLDQVALKEEFQFLPPLIAVLIALIITLISVNTYHRSIAVKSVVPLFHRYNTRPRAPPRP